MKLLIKGGRVLDPASGIDRQLDVLIDTETGRIVRVESGLKVADRIINASDKFVTPGWVDIHVHLREPGQEYKEDILSGTQAAVAGGYTSICCMPNTAPVNDQRSVTELIVRRAKEVNSAHVYPIGAMTKGLEGKQLAEYADMQAAGIVAVSDDGKCVMNSGLMRRAMEYAATFGLPVIQHCEDHPLSCGVDGKSGAMNEGAVSTRLGLTAQPVQAESIIVARDLELVELTGAQYHAAHLSTAASLRHIRWAKARGLAVSCEVTPHHFTLTDEVCENYDPASKVNPPLRCEVDVEAVKQALHDGTVDAIATDHAPHSVQDKQVEFGCAAFGISGLETAIPLCLDLWRGGVVDLNRLVALVTCNPARLLNLPAGTLAAGVCADVTVIDPDATWTVEPEKFFSKGKNTPFGGRAMRGRAQMTIVGGAVRYGNE